MQNEAIHAVELTRQIRDRMYEETKDLAPEEFLRYVKEHSEAARRRVNERTAGMQTSGK